MLAMAPCIDNLSKHFNHYSHSEYHNQSQQTFACGCCQAQYDQQAAELRSRLKDADTQIQDVKQKLSAATAKAAEAAAAATTAHAAAGKMHQYSSDACHVFESLGFVACCIATRLLHSCADANMYNYSWSTRYNHG